MCKNACCHPAGRTAAAQPPNTTGTPAARAPTPDPDWFDALDPAKVCKCSSAWCNMALDTTRNLQNEGMTGIAPERRHCCLLHRCGQSRPHCPRGRHTINCGHSRCAGSGRSRSCGLTCGRRCRTGRAASPMSPAPLASVRWRQPASTSATHFCCSLAAELCHCCLATVAQRLAQDMCWGAFAGKTHTVKAVVPAEAALLGPAGRRDAAPQPALVYINCMSLDGNPLLARVAEGLQRNLHRTPKQVRSSPAASTHGGNRRSACAMASFNELA